MRFQVQSVSVAGPAVLPGGQVQERVSVNLVQIADEGESNFIGGNNLNLVLPVDEAATYFPGQRYAVTLTRETVAEEEAPSEPGI